MSTKCQTKLVQEGEYVAKVEVEVMESTDGWGPCLSANDARRLDEVREALRFGNLSRASRLGGVYRLTPVTA